ncbi:PREDICTED: serine protease SP24D-like [Rhagoletis zephyria]|uniref:serine protease SP24D-like n=1 Tax=Rhagoletis zephyria TaxID=28612 RepID=UPI0008118A7E|nr:PREDICTED: serine protease SP24D-like [Rhagoletis zephyria]
MVKKSISIKTYLIFCAFAVLKLVLCETNVAVYRQKPQSRIYGGRTAASGQFPYQVLLNCRANGQIRTCGGAIISRNYILTAAHCVEDYEYTPEDITVRAGSVMYDEGGVLEGVSKVTIHPQYHNFTNDIAILKLNSPLKYNEAIKYIRLGKTQVPEGASVTVSGWGLSPVGTLPEQLKYNTEYTISHEECENAIGTLAQSMRCFKKRVGNGICEGDSGGPAVYGSDLIGVAAFTVNGCGSNLPDVYTDVVAKRNWILQHIKSQKL